MSIEHRPKEVNKRDKLGHHEMDLIVGSLGSKKCLIVITERLSRYEHIVWMPDKTQLSVRRALNKLESHYGKAFKDLFKTITCDNGSEFLDSEFIAKSRWGKAKRCVLYYAHPYCSSKRGSNKDANRLIRRFIPKGKSMANITQEDVSIIACCAAALAKQFTFHYNAA